MLFCGKALVSTLPFKSSYSGFEHSSTDSTKSARTSTNVSRSLGDETFFMRYIVVVEATGAGAGAGRGGAPFVPGLGAAGFGGVGVGMLLTIRTANLPFWYDWSLT